MGPFAVLMLIGVRVREVRDLEEGSLWIGAYRLLIIDAALDREEREDVCREVLGRVAEEPAA